MTTTNETSYKREFTFVDANRNKVTAECEITHRNKYPEFTASGNYANVLGQVFDQVKPANKAQRQFIELWRKWHLNGMNAGTPEQTALLENKAKWTEFKSGNNIQTIVFSELFNEQRDKVKKMLLKDGSQTSEEIERYLDSAEGRKNIADDIFNKAMALGQEIEDKDPDGYTARCYFLKFFGKYEVAHPKTGEPYKYGHGWIVNDLPNDFEETLDVIIDEIEEAEEERKGANLAELSDDELLQIIEEETSFSGRDAELCAALVKMLDLCRDDLNDIEINDTNVTVQGENYIAGDDDEMNDAWDEELDNYLEECVYPELPETMRQYFDDDKWKDDAKHDGRGHSLNRYDGGEEEQEINGTYYYAYKQLYIVKKTALGQYIPSTF